jgi:hypothetical protein
VPAQVAPALEWAWERCRVYGDNAGRTRVAFLRLQLTILVVGVGATLFALTESALVAHHVVGGSSVAGRVLHAAVLVLPITLAVLLGAAARFRTGNKWVDLRAAAEGVKREIFRYRSRTGHYAPDRTTHISRDQLLSEQVAAIGRGLMQTELSQTALGDSASPVRPHARSPGSSDDDGFSDLTPEAYVKHRVDDQIRYYGSRATRLARILRLLQSVIFVAGGVGTLLAALHVDIWIALTTALVGAVTTYLGYEQIENTLVTYNQARTALIAIKGWWASVPEETRTSPRTMEYLVNQTERILQKEQGGWVQEMTEAMAQLRADEERRGGSGPESDVSEGTPERESANQE